MTTTRNALLLLALALVFIVPAGVQASSPCEDPNPGAELCGTTVLTGTGPSVISAHLSAAATLDLAGASGPNVREGKTVDIKGGAGPFVGFAIAEDREDRRGLGLVFARIPAEASASAWPYFWSGFGTTLGSKPAQVTLASGNYRFYLLTEPGSSATVTLTFSGLDGIVELNATSATRFETLRLDARLVEADGVPIHSVGASRTLPGTGVAFAVFPLETSFHLITAQAYCFNEFLFGEPVPDEIVFLPGCPMIADHAVVYAATSPGPFFQRADVLAGVLPPGRYGFGYTYAGAAQIDARVPSYEAWLALD